MKAARWYSPLAKVVLAHMYARDLRCFWDTLGSQRGIRIPSGSVHVLSGAYVSRFKIEIASSSVEAAAAAAAAGQS